jgi:hypothetical protein
MDRGVNKIYGFNINPGAYALGREKTPSSEKWFKLVQFISALHGS